MTDPERDPAFDAGADSALAAVYRALPWWAWITRRRVNEIRRRFTRTETP